MGTAYIQTVITAEEGGVFLFECEPVAEIEYSVEDDELSGWTIRDFRFDLHSSIYDPATQTVVRKKTREAWCADDLRPVLTRFADREKIESDLIDYLADTGELKDLNEEHSAFYRRSVL